MSQFTNPLNNVKIASPCSQDWNEMIGTERKRFCGECRLNVYNLSAMSPDEAENLLLNSEGRLCVRFYRRADGSVLTKDCPVGWQALKRRVSKVSTAAASMIFGIVGGLGLSGYFNFDNEREVTVTGEIAVVENFEQSQNSVPINSDKTIEMGKVPPQYAVAGGISNLQQVQGEFKKNRRR